jgi:bifunctional non-homologous end joining protein LigD
VCADLPTLVWLANLAAIELHPLLARAEAVDRPRLLMFDLDPGPPAGVLDAAEVAVIVHDLLADAGFEPLVKTSGSKGVHVAVPLDGVHDYTPIRLLSRHVAEYLERTHRERCVSTQDKARRAGKVLVDWNQNGPTNTTASVYSLRARAMPQVSTPVTWDEIAAAVAAKDPAALQFGPEAVLARIAEHGDLWSAAVTSTTPSAPALARLARLLGD